jgi:hypothetical protein
MAKFVECATDEGHVVHVNLEQVLSLTAISEGRGTVIKFVTGDIIAVTTLPGVIVSAK